MLMSLFFFFFLFFLAIFFSNWVFFNLLIFFFFPMFFFNYMSDTFLSKNLFISLDSYSFIMILLTIWIMVLSFISGFSYFNSHFSKYLLLIFLSLLFFLAVTFILNGVLSFFIAFECTLLPILLIIIGWGYKIERLSSGIYLFFYTLFGSLPMLSVIFYCYNFNKTLFFNISDFSFSNMFIMMFSIFAFLVKMPMFLVHSWLPKAHVEAPVIGSMILAGILLKLGGYGIFRFMFFYKYFLSFNIYWIYLSCWGGLISSFICLRQLDLKSLVAYSSVAHMSLVIMGLLVNNYLGIFGSFMMMVGHGLCSSCLFFLVNVIFERSLSRSIILNKGLSFVFPTLMLWWFLLCVSNMGSPPSLNLLSEIFLMGSLVGWSKFLVLIFMLLSFFGAAYSLFLFSFCFHGKTSNFIFFFNSSFIREYFILFLHWLPLNLFFLKMDFFF